MSLVIKRYADLSEPFFFYNGEERLRFSKSIWTYFRETSEGLTPLSGVTGTCHIIDRSSALMPWAVKMALRRVFALMQDHKRADGFYELYFTELEKILDASKKADREELEAAGDIGHVAHDWIESYIKSVLADNTNRTLELLAKLPEDERAANCCVAAIGWMDAHNVRWVATERRVFSRTFLYAGTLDGLAKVDSCSDPLCCPHEFKDRLSIVDWKTSNYLYVEYLLQTAAYWQAHVEETGDQVVDRWINRLGKDDAEFDSWHAEGGDLFAQDFTAFRHALELSQDLKQIESRISDVREARREYKKKIRDAEKAAQMKIECEKAKTYKGTRKSKCLPDGSQCEACAKKYSEMAQKRG